MGMGETLVAKGVITEAQLAEANARRESTGQRLDRALVDVGAVTSDALLAAMGEILHLPVIDLDAVTVDVDVLRTGERLVASGSIPTTWTDYGVEPPNLGFVTVDGAGSVDFLVTLEQN